MKVERERHSHRGKTTIVKTQVLHPCTCAMASVKQQVASKALRALESFLPQSTPPSLDTSAANLCQVLSRYPHDGVGMQVSQIRWGQKGIADSYWLVTRAKLKLEGRHGKIWGKLYWKGKHSVAECSRSAVEVQTLIVLFSGVLTSHHEQRIPGSLKYNWRIGPSRVPAGFRWLES